MRFVRRFSKVLIPTFLQDPPRLTGVRRLAIPCANSRSVEQNVSLGGRVVVEMAWSLLTLALILSIVPSSEDRSRLPDPLCGDDPATSL